MLKIGRKFPTRLLSDRETRAGALVRFSIDRRWAMLVVAVLLGAGGGSLLGFVTAPVADGDAQGLAPAQQVASSTTRRQRGRFAGASSTTTRARPRAFPAATAGLSPATTSTSTVRPTTTTAAPTTSTTVEPTSTTTTTTVVDTTSSSSVPSSTTSTT
jgi:hypothetical protein